ncbi:SMP-30/gluconolactonase/LRE family protein [Sphingomonas alpina]|uniref:SMP-30/gluconolactonase/LRE family protein n=1 Tax=Sphingomonas alpina TaxID=653931 RepID=A0A7H0LD64_9SPHN|nr:SMP-30/gluconolactonase/LRE family protein [Sphingomonas alpina]QNQ07617.1 SMP-30/gluconolactonase/LRE family protein [Sphingomonas alpina]
MQATHLLSVGAELGEGPVWIDGALWFVDIKGRRIYRQVPITGALDQWDAPEFIGWILPATKGDLIAGLQSGPHRFSPESGIFTRIAEIDPDLPANRLNDAAIHPSGRLYFGTMDNDEAMASGRVFLLDGGAVRATGIDPCVITNGPAIAPAGDRLYHVDTLARRVSIHPIDAVGNVGAGATFLHFTGDEGHPDGAICDAEGGVWIAFYGGGAARRYDTDGHMTDEIIFPVSNVTKVALGGSDGRTAYATTARQGLSADALAAQPLAGDVFTFPVKIPGMPVTRANS